MGREGFDVVDVACDAHDAHPIWEMAKRWVERDDIRTREAYCPEDEAFLDPLATWTGSSWILLPGRGVTTAWCRQEGKEVPLEDLETETRAERKGEVTYALCPSCGAEVAKRNRWRYWEPLYLKPEEADTPAP